MRKLFFLFILLALFALLIGVGASPLAAQGSDYKLTVLHTSENHGHWETMTFSEVSQGGIARRATLVKKLRGEIPNTLLVDSGDVSQGTLYFIQYKSVEGKDFYNTVGYDAVELGNHEFDLGPKVLADNFLSGAKFSALMANVDVSQEPLLAGKIAPSVTKTVGGEKIGLFGMITDDLPTNSSPGPNIKMKDAVQTAKDMVAEFTKQGINKIILLSHRGLKQDLDLAGKVDGIDVIVAGHTNELFGDSAKLDKSLPAAYAPYPLSVNTPKGDRTLIVHAFEWGRVLGRLDVTFNAKGEVVNWDGGPIFVDKNIADDATVAAKLTELGKPLESLKKQFIGKTNVDLDGERTTVRFSESNFGDLIADAMLGATANDKTQIAITNGGGIRTSIKAGDVSYGNVLEVLPFGNRLVQFDLNGAEVVTALENGVSQRHDATASNGRFPQVSGIKFTADMKQEVGKRVKDVQVGAAKSGYKPIDPKATYRIVSNDFMANGGDGYSVFRAGRNVRGGDVPIDQAVSDYIKANSPVSPKVEGRITLENAPVAAATATPAATAAAPATAAATATSVPATAVPTKAPATATPAPKPTTMPSTGGEMPNVSAWVALVGLLLLATAFAILRARRA